MKKFEGFQKGVDLGGWLSQGSYDKAHLDSFITEGDFARIAGWGCDHVRLPIDYNIFETDEGTPIDDGFELVDRALTWCEKHNLNMLIDVHKVYGYSFYSGDGEDGFFDSDELQKRYYKWWERLAERYGKFPERVAFELLNEVNDKELSGRWNSIAKQAVKIIRPFAPKTKIVLGSYWNNSVDALADLDMPYDENKIDEMLKTIGLQHGKAVLKNRPFELSERSEKVSFWITTTEGLLLSNCSRAALRWWLDPPTFLSEDQAVARRFRVASASSSL